MGVRNDVKGNGEQNQAKGVICLMTAALIWGFAFVAQAVGMDHVGPFAFNAVRNLIGGTALLPVLCFLRSRQSADERTTPEESRKERQQLLRGGIVCGTTLCIASNFQQVGIKYTSVGKAGFITALYIVIVPAVGIILGRRTGIRIWISVAAAVAGLYLLCLTERLSLGKGDALVLICAFAFALQITAVDHYSRVTDGTMLACAEFFVCGILTLIPMLFTEHPSAAGLWAARFPILYAGVFSSGVAYTMQILGQKELDPTLASLIMSFESVISVLAGWLLLHQHLSGREICGCIVMFGAILLAQLPEKKQSA